MLAAALEAEVDASMAALVGERDQRGRSLVVRNGHAQPRHVMTAAGAVEVRTPRVKDKRVDPQTGELCVPRMPIHCQNSMRGL